MAGVRDVKAQELGDKLLFLAGLGISSDYHLTEAFFDRITGGNQDRAFRHILHMLILGKSPFCYKALNVQFIGDFLM